MTDATSGGLQVVIWKVLLVISGSDDITPIIYVPYVYLVKLIYFIFFL